jgi:hypothetical protein
MRGNKLWIMLLCALVLLVGTLASPPAMAEETPKEKPKNPWFVTVLGGEYSGS